MTSSNSIGVSHPQHVSIGHNGGGISPNSLMNTSLGNLLFTLGLNLFSHFIVIWYIV